MIIIHNHEYFLKSVLFGMVLHLFSNDYTPNRDDSIGKYRETEVFGYAPVYVDINSLEFKNNYVIMDRTFVIMGSTNVFGFYLTVNDNLFSAERFKNAPYRFNSAGGEMRIKSNIYLMGK